MVALRHLDMSLETQWSISEHIKVCERVDNTEYAYQICQTRQAPRRVFYGTILYGIYTFMGVCL